MTSAYLSAATVDEALRALASGARPVAGGTDLVVGARQGKAPLPESIVAIDRLDDLRGVEVADGRLRLGALVTHAEIASDPVVLERLTALADASAIVGSHSTRSHGTIGGNLMNASPAMEAGGPLIVLGATVTLRSGSGERQVPVAELMTGPGTTVAAADELLTGVEIPLPEEGTGSAYVRLEYRRQMEIAVVGATAAVTLAGGTVRAGRRRHHGACADDPARARGSGGAGRFGRRRGSRAGGRTGRGRRGRAHLRRARLRRLPAGDGGGRGAARAHRGSGPRGRRTRSGACQQRRLRRRGVKLPLTLSVNGNAYPLEVAPGTTLLDAVRDGVGLTGAKEGCDDSECGACMMLLDGKPVNSCSYLALQAEGREVTTVEGLAAGESLSALQREFLEQGGVQCGFCTPGMLISATSLLERNPQPSEDEVRIALAGNLCRCTGYDGIVKAVLAAAG